MFKQISLSKIEYRVEIRKIKVCKKNRSRSGQARQSTFVLAGSTFDRRKAQQFQATCFRNDMALEGYSHSSCGSWQKGRKNQLASTSSKVPHSYFLNIILFTMKSTDVSPHHLNTKNLEQEVTANGQPQELPSGNIITRPVSCIDTCPHTVASANNKWSSIFLFQELVRGHSSQMTKVSVNLLMLEIIAGLAVMIQVNIDSHHVNGFVVLDAIILYGWLISFKI